jgi:hypothetical protein
MTQQYEVKIILISSSSFHLVWAAHTLVILEGKRNPNMESLYDYGSRAGFWRMHRLFTSKKIPVTVFAAGMVR